MLKLAGYADRLSARPGDAISFKVSNATGAPVSARFVRVISADPNPAGPGIREEHVANLATMSLGEYPVPRGSYGIADVGSALSKLQDFTFVLSIKPTILPENGCSKIVSLGDDANGIHVTIDANSCINIATADKSLSSAGQRLNKWLDVAISFVAHSKQLTLRTKPVQTFSDWSSVSLTLEHGALLSGSSTLQIAGPSEPGSSTSQFDGRIEKPQLYDRVLTEAEIEATRTGNSVAEGAVFAFDFSKGASTSTITDVGPNAFTGRLVNHPTRALRGSRWSGHEMCFRHAASEYGAIHFHSDAMTDCEWPTAFVWTVPDDLKSGCYALRIDAGDHSENVPFFIAPPKGKPGARIAVLISTFTYTIYANHARPEFRLSKRWAKAWREQSSEWNAYPHNPADHPEYGWSTYNDHRDGSGISISSWHRPILNTRIGYVTYPYPDIRASGLRHYPADTHLNTWLEDQGYDFDIITDQELHDEGLDLLRDYTVLLTGSHPEYHTREMLDALEQYRDSGGRLMYLGGNGFYWKIALDPERRGVIEIRRAEGGIRAWAAEAGEYYNQFDGEYGGMWRRNARPPQDLVGVGFSAQGNFVGSHYVVDEDARNSRASWILEGIDDNTFGGHGLSGHGAAGFELDRADKTLGTPAHAVILATSEGHEPEAPWVLVPEERLTHLTNISGESEAELIRSDIVFFETPGQGAVFSVGSITYCGSLLTNGGDNDISKMTRNVLDRFCDAASPFEIPPS